MSCPIDMYDPKHFEFQNGGVEFLFLRHRWGSQMQSSSVCLSAPLRHEASVTQGGSASVYFALWTAAPHPSSGARTQSLIHAQQKHALHLGATPQSLSFA